MDVYSIARTCLRRWYAFLFILIATGAVCYVQLNQAKATYSRTETMLISPPAQTSSQTEATTSNPLGSTAGALAALVARLNASDVTSVADQFQSTYVGAVASQRGAIVTLSADGSSSLGTQDALAAYATASKDAFQKLQAQVGAPKSAYFNLTVLKPDAGAAATYPSRAKTVGVTAVVGLLFAILVAELLDVAISSRRRVSRRRSVGRSNHALQPSTESISARDRGLNVTRGEDMTSINGQALSARP